MDREFAKFVQEQNALVGEGNLAGNRDTGAASDQGCQRR
jgi:hypothetical protein